MVVVAVAIVIGGVLGAVLTAALIARGQRALELTPSDLELPIRPADRWRAETPPLMAKDHLHFTIAGYKKSATAFLDTLVPVIDKVRSRSDAVSNN